MHPHRKQSRLAVPKIWDAPRERLIFSFPHEVIDDSSLNLAEKRAILAEWASDKSAVESYPTLRQLPGTTFPVTFATIMDARQKLDQISVTEDEDESGNDRLGQLVTAKFARSRRGGEGAPQ